jgi:FkbM family methyltransferase
LKAIALGARLPRWKPAEDFKQQGRTIDELRRRRIDLVLDVGANVGFYAKHLRQAGYKGRIMSFEPDPGTFDRLKTMAEGDPGWDTYNCALGDAPGELPFHVIRSGSETVLSSVLAPLSHEVSAEIRVPVDTIQHVLEREQISDRTRIFLKMDTQGYDLKVFAGAKGTTGIELLQSELSVVPLYSEMPHYTEALTRFEESGFKLLELFVVRRDGGGAVVEYDALMARD